jgi:uncharacterized repeat protein (TIGR04138 family)
VTEPSGTAPAPPEDSWEKIKRLSRETPRYETGAYLMLLAALEETVRNLPARRHVTGQELCHGIRRYLLREYGPMARVVLDHWGCRATADFGNIVYNLIRVGLLSRTETDRIEDFASVYDFALAFSLDSSLASDKA